MDSGISRGVYWRRKGLLIKIVSVLDLKKAEYRAHYSQAWWEWWTLMCVKRPGRGSEKNVKGGGAGRMGKPNWAS